MLSVSFWIANQLQHNNKIYMAVNIAAIIVKNCANRNYKEAVRYFSVLNFTVTLVCTYIFVFEK